MKGHWNGPQSDGQGFSILPEASSCYWRSQPAQGKICRTDTTPCSVTGVSAVKGAVRPIHWHRTGTPDPDLGAGREEVRKGFT